MEGGYVLINLADIKLFERLLITLDLGKPILLRDGKQNYFIDKITGGNVTAYEDDGVTPSTYADIVLTSAIGTITIKQNGTITKASNPDTSELNAIKDYVDTLKELVSYNSESDILSFNPETSFNSDVQFNNVTMYNGYLDNFKLNSNLDVNNNDIDNIGSISGSSFTLDSDGWLLNNDNGEIIFGVEKSGDTSYGKLEFDSDGDGFFIECKNEITGKKMTIKTSGGVMQSLTADTAYEFKEDGIYLNDVKITKYYYNVILDNTTDLHINTIISSNIELQSLTYNELLLFLENNTYTSLTNLIATGVKSTNSVIGLFYEDDMGSNKIFAKTGYGSSSLISSTGLSISIKKL